jgi:SAM-dependent methyltransferase
MAPRARGGVTVPSAFPRERPGPPVPNEPATFEEFAQDYESLLHDPLRRCFAADSGYFIAQKCRALLRRLDRGAEPGARQRVLDVGCGQGASFPFLQGHMVVGADVSREMLLTAVQRGPVVTQEACRLPFQSAAFDAAFAFCVYHHIPEAERLSHLREVSRVVRPGGWVFAFEHNGLNPVTRLVFKRAPIDRGCELIPRRRLQRLLADAGLQDVTHGYVMFVPEFLSRIAGPIEPYLEWLPLGGQYYVCGRTEGSGVSS